MYNLPITYAGITYPAKNKVTFFDVTFTSDFGIFKQKDKIKELIYYIEDGCLFTIIEGKEITQKVEIITDKRQKIIFLKGLPASGKSTWSAQFVKDNPDFIRINKDDLRKFFGNPKFSRSFEKGILALERQLGLAALKLKKSLIVDDTNFNPKHQKYWESIAHLDSLEFEVKLFDTPLEECIKRDKEREKSVGESVIRSMYKKYIEVSKNYNTK